MGQETARVDDGVLTPPFVRRVENRKGAYPGEFIQVRPLRLFHMGLEGKTQKCLVPIVWKRILNPGVTDHNGIPADRTGDVLTRVECIGLVWGDFLGKTNEQVVTMRFEIPLRQYLDLQIGLVEI